MACLYQRYLSENIEQPSAVFFGIEEHAEIKKSKIKLNFEFFKSKKFLKIINIATFTDQKDHLTLLMSVKKLSKFIKCKLVIIGRGYKEKKLRKYILENNLQKIVKLVGYKKNPESYIKISDVFVLTSTYEGLPNVLIESLYLKKEFLQFFDSHQMFLLTLYYEY